ncbi:MAG: hypothetical protein QOK48_3757 [Blastocatellia bacterium]|jgi:hypothetical protein|nr:hypothetical protein [Blastocatellia bacterium]
MPKQTIFSRLFFKRDNLISLITILAATTIAILGLVSTHIPMSLLLSAILIVLSLLAVTNIIERESRFDSADRKLESIIQLGRVGGAMFENFRDIPPLENYTSGAHELFFTGGHLNGVVLTNTNLFKEWLKPGRSLKFILQNPNNIGLRHLEMPCVNYNYDEYVKQIRLSLERLHTLQTELPEAKIEVRLTDISPTQSVLIVDGHEGGTEMRLLIHIPSGDASTAPFVRLSRAHDKVWFNIFFNKYYKHMWDKATPSTRHNPDQP